MVLEDRESWLAIVLLCRPSLISEFFVPSLVGILRFVAPDADRRIVRTRDERVDFFNNIDLIDPVSMVVQVRHKRDSSFLDSLH